MTRQVVMLLPHPTSCYATASSHQLLCYCLVPPVVMLLPHPTSCYATASSHQLLCYCLIPPVVTPVPHPTSCYASASSHQLLLMLSLFECRIKCRFLSFLPVTWKNRTLIFMLECNYLLLLIMEFMSMWVRLCC